MCYLSDVTVYVGDHFYLPLIFNRFWKISKSLTSCSSIFFPFAVDADEIKRLGKRFRKLDLDNSGSLSVDEFMSLPELQQNPLVQRVIDIFDTDGNGEVDFKGNLRTFLKIYIWLPVNIYRCNSRKVFPEELPTLLYLGLGLAFLFTANFTEIIFWLVLLLIMMF